MFVVDSRRADVNPKTMAHFPPMCLTNMFLTTLHQITNYYVLKLDCNSVHQASASIEGTPTVLSTPERRFFTLNSFHRLSILSTLKDIPQRQCRRTSNQQILKLRRSTQIAQLYRSPGKPVTQLLPQQQQLCSFQQPW